MKKNELYTVDITDLNNLGNGVAKIDGKAVFVPRAVDGDKLEIKIIKDTKDYAIARIEKILTPSLYRQESGCAVSNRCGGCVYRHITYAHECELKHNYVASAFRKAGVSAKVAPTLSGAESGYRNKVQYPVAEGMTFGFYAPRSHDIIPCADCALQDEAFTPILAEIADLLRKSGVSVYNELTHTGLLRHVYLRRGSVSGEIMLTLVTSSAKFPQGKAFAEEIRKKFPEIVSVVQNINPEKTNVILGDRCITLSGKDHLTDTLCGLTFNLSPLSFYQVNHHMAEVLYAKAEELAELRAGDRIADLFCGAGTIGLSVAAKHPEISLLGVEIIPEAVENAKENAKQNGIENATFICGDANSSELASADVIFLDPPRKGCEESLVKQIAALSPRKVVYISCNPDTLARDVARFIEVGYTPGVVYPVDLFPRTGHCEAVVALTREPTVHPMKLQPSPFEKIKRGVKTIELRLYDEKRQQIKAGDTIEFTNTANGERLRASVKKLHRFGSFAELYSTLPLLKCGYTEQDVDSAHPSDMEQYYSAEEQKAYGVVGIELVSIESITR